MLKKQITYENPFTEKEVTEEHYFHISKADLVQMEMEEHNNEYTDKNGKKYTGMQAKLQRIVDSQDGKAIMAELRDIIRRSYGKKDGDRFLKSSEIWENFASTEAYSQLIFDLCTDANAAGEFINGIVPGNLEQAIAQAQATASQQGLSGDVPARAKAATALLEDGSSPTETIEPRLLTAAEVLEMDPVALKAGIAEGRYKLS